MVERESYTSFAGNRMLASGDLKTMLLRTKAYIDRGGRANVVIFDDLTGRQLEFNFRGTPEKVLDRARAVAKPRGRGRPRLGVTSREISLLPRHWEWLADQPSGVSAALRRLVDEAQKREGPELRARRIREAAGRFMSAMASRTPEFDEAWHALFARNDRQFKRLIHHWPEDIRKHLSRLVQEAARLENGVLQSESQPASV